MFILAIVLLIASGLLFYLAHITEDTNYDYPKTASKVTAIIVLCVGIVMGVLSFFTVVPTGYTGILTTFGRIEPNTIDAGINFKLPWQQIVQMDNREQKVEFSEMAFSADIQQVDLQGSIVYCIDKSTAMDLYRTVGTDYSKIVIVPQIKEDVKSIVSKYTAENLVEKRAVLSGEILTLLQEDLSAYGLNIVSVAIENIDFTDAFEAAVEAKQVATQTKQRAETEQAQATMEAEQAALRQTIAANAAAEVARIEADAEAYATEKQAEANIKLAESLTDSLVDYYRIQNWDGKLPTTYFSGSNSSTMFEIPIE